MGKDYRSGTVESYDDRSGYGYIRTDDGEGSGEEILLVHRRSLRSPGTPLTPGDRVVFMTENVARGLLAVDVHFEAAESEEEELIVGRIVSVNVARGFGFIESSAHKRFFFHFSQLLRPEVSPVVGANVTFRKQLTDRGEQAFRVALVGQENEDEIFVADPSLASDREDFLPKAILARDNKQLDEAAKLYAKGLKFSPSVQLVTSYAAMEKNRNRRADAMSVYEQGLKVFPNNVKLLEDAGLLAATMGDFKKALEFLQRGLALSRQTEPGGERLFLLAIARIYAKRDSGRTDLEEALKYYDLAQNAFASSRHGKAAFPKDDLLAMNVTKIRLQHYRGDLAYEFVQNAGFRMIRATLFDQITVGADFILEPKTASMLDGYGISGNLLLRCMFKSDIVRSDIDSIDEFIRNWGVGGLIDEQVVLLLVASLPENVERLLYQRLEDRKQTVPAIVPITQSQIETADRPYDVLREVLDRWLYRRDLFAQNFPVSGRRFFGRERSLAEIRDSIDNGIAAGIFGLRKVGKTSLLKEIERRANEDGDIAIYLDLLRIPADISDTRWLYWKLGRELFTRAQRKELKGIRWRIGEQYRDYFDVPDQFPIATAFDSDLSQVLDVLRGSHFGQRQKVVVMLDEIERLLPNASGKEGFKGFFDFFSYIRGVAQESADFVPIVTGANAAIAEAAQFVGRDNPVFNFFREIYLPLLRREESVQMIQTLGRGMGVKFSTETAERLHTLTGGHPFFARQLCSFVCERYSQRPLAVTVSMVDDLVDAYLEIAGRDFKEIIDRFSRDYPEELDVCDAVAQAGGAIDLNQLSLERTKTLSLRHLVGYQIVSISDNTVSLTMELMKRWLRNGGYSHAR